MFFFFFNKLAELVSRKVKLECYSSPAFRTETDVKLAASIEATDTCVGVSSTDTRLVNSFNNVSVRKPFNITSEVSLLQ